MNEDLKQQILQANLDLHAAEAAYYDTLHAEHYCRAEARLVDAALARALQQLKAGGLQALDLGAGTGHITIKLAGQAEIASVTAVDLSAAMLAELRKKIRTSSARHKITAIEADLNGFFESNPACYDLITVSSVLHHLPDYALSLKKIIRHLKPRGICILFLEPTGETSLLLKLLRWLDLRLYNRLCLPRQIRALAAKLDYSFADYHVSRGFSLRKITDCLMQDNSVFILFRQRYNLLKISFFRLLGKWLRRKNTFLLIFRKKA